MKQGNSPV